MSSLPDYIKQLKARLKNATPGPWVWADTTILDSDREAQRRKEPYWTLVEPVVSHDLFSGKLGDKFKEHDEAAVARAIGHDAEGISISNADAELIAHAPQDLERLIRIVEIQREALAEAKQHFHSIMSGLTVDITKVEPMTKDLAWKAGIEVRSAQDKCDKIASGEVE